MLRLYFFEILQHRSTVLITFCLFVLYVITVPLMIGLSPELINHFHVGLIWICLLFAFIPERFVQYDFEDGTLEMYFLSTCAIQPILICKILGVWCLKVSGILCTFPILGIVYHFEHYKELALDLLCGSFVFTLICAIHSCLTLGTGEAWNLQHLTTLPTLLPFIMLCTSVPDLDHLVALIGLLSVFLWIFWVFVPLTLYNILSH